MDRRVCYSYFAGVRLTASLKAINQLLVGLPVSLYDGFVSGVTARIPFPNPLSSSVGFHVQSLNLTFQITPEQSISPASPSFRSSSNLADSVVSVAETFIHDELTPREGATLRQTLRPSSGSLPLADESENLPGGFNPFGYNLNAEEARKEPHGDDDPAGVSVFATLIERLLAKFEFSAVDTRVTIIYPGRASFTLSVSELTYHTDQSPRSETNSGLQSASGGSNRCGQIRTVSISGLKVTSRDLCVVASSPTVTSTLSPVSFTSSRTSSPLHFNQSVDQISRNSSSSSLDEDAQFMMSQSIAMLPPSSLHLSSASSSMYQSAISTAHAQPVKVDNTTTPLSALQINDNINNIGRARPPPISVSCQDPVEDVLLSFGSQPIVFSLQTPPRRTQPSGQIPQAGGDHPANPEDFDKPEQETLKLSVMVGTLACAFRSGHLRVLLDIVDACVPKLPTPSPVSRKEASSSELPRAALRLDANVIIRGIVIIALPEPATREVFSLDTFYERPLVPPRQPCTYLRLFLDALSITFRLSTSSESPDLSVSGVPRTSSVPVNQSISAKMVVSDLSLFAFHAVSSVDDSQVAAPILIIDPYLPTSHVARHYRPSLASERPKDIKLPEFEIVDWTQAKLKSGSAKLSTWRLRNRVVSGKADKPHAPFRRHCDLPDSPNPFILSEMEDKLPPPAAVEVSSQLTLPFPSKEHSWTVDVKMAPLHLFFDLGMAFKDDLLMHFVDDIASAAIFTPRKTTDMLGSQNFRQQSLGELSEDVDVERDIHIRQTSPHAREREEERKRLEALVLEDLNLAMKYQRTGTSKLKSSRHQSASLKRKVGALVHLLRSLLKTLQKPVPSEPGFSLRLTCPVIRVEVRCPPPPPHLPRSGCMLFDLRGLTISNDPPSTKSSLRFSEETKSSPPRSSDNISNVILSVRLQEMLAAYSSVGDNVAHVILTLGFLPSNEVGPDTSALLATETVPDTLPLSVVLGRPNIARRSASNLPSRLTMTVDIPLVNLVMDKAVFDGLQCWADDVAQLIGRSFTTPDSATETLPSRNPSLIGSRYFTQSRRSGTHSTDESVVEKSNHQNTGETVVKINVTEGKSFLPEKQRKNNHIVSISFTQVYYPSGWRPSSRPTVGYICFRCGCTD
jgi:autophagy-related protein 2